MSRTFYPQARAILSVIFDGYGGNDSDPLVIPVLPKSLTVHKNSYKQADSWELVFDANDLPLDPDLVRAGSCEIYLYQTAGLLEDQRVINRQDPKTAANYRRTGGMSQLAERAAGGGDIFSAGQRPLIAGLFDEDALALDDSGKWVTISGQDYTAHLASMQWPPTESGRARKIPVGQRIDLMLADVLAEADPDGRLRLDVRNLSLDELPVVGASEVSGNRRGIPVEQDTKYWDVMYKVATRHGLILFVDGLDVVLTRPQNLAASDLGSVRQFAWGRNVESLNLTRALGKEQTPTIVVQGYDPKSKRTITVEYPEGKRELTDKVVKGDIKKTTSTVRLKAKTPAAHHAKHGKKVTTIRKTDEFEIVPMYGVTDPGILRAAAANLYHLLGRAERKVVLKTKDLKDLEETDLLSLRAGSAVTINFDDYNRELLADPNVPITSKVDHLLARGYNETVAQEFAQRFAKLEALRRPLRVREVTFDFDVDEGISIEMELVDFVVVDGARDGVDKSTRIETREASLRKDDGSRVGLGASAAEEAARLAQMGSK